MNNCDLVKDLIPLYIEDLTTYESRVFVEEHINSCEECKEYYNRLKKDFEENQQKKPDDNEVNSVMDKIIKYEKRIKLLSISIAMFITAIVLGARVQFFDTIPVLILVPLLARIFYKKTSTIVLMSIPTGIVAGILSGNIQKLLILSILIPIVALVICIIVKLGEGSLVFFKKLKRGIRATASALLIIVALLINNYFYSNPIEYVYNLVKVNLYVSEKYDVKTPFAENIHVYNKDILKFNKLNYNYKSKMYIAKYNTYLNRWSSDETVTIMLDGKGIYDVGYVYGDGYADTMRLMFASERANYMQIILSNKIENNLYIFADAIEDLNINKYCLNEFYAIRGDDADYNKATEARENECAKLEYNINLGTDRWQLDKMSKDDFINKSIEIYNEIKKEGFLYKDIKISAYNNEDKVQSVIFDINSGEEELRNSYKIESFDY